jgi:hypothetical protein
MLQIGAFRYFGPYAIEAVWGVKLWFWTATILLAIFAGFILGVWFGPYYPPALVGTPQGCAITHGQWFKAKPNRQAACVFFDR